MDKEFWKSKTFWGAFLGILGVIGAFLRGELDFVTAWTAAAAFFTIFGIRAAL